MQTRKTIVPSKKSAKCNQKKHLMNKCRSTKDLRLFIISRPFLEYLFSDKIYLLLKISQKGVRTTYYSEEGRRKLPSKSGWFLVVYVNLISSKKKMNNRSLQGQLLFSRKIEIRKSIFHIKKTWPFENFFNVYTFHLKESRERYYMLHEQIACKVVKDVAEGYIRGFL